MVLGPNGYRLGGLRTDERQWLIYDDETLGALMRGIEAMCLSMAGQTLSKHRVPAVRAIGSFAVKVADSRLEEMMRNDGAQRVVVQHLSKISQWLAGRFLKPPAQELDEIHAAIVRLDGRATRAGIGGPGVHREAVRGD